MTAAAPSPQAQAQQDAYFEAQTQRWAHDDAELRAQAQAQQGLTEAIEAFERLACRQTTTGHDQLIAVVRKFFAELRASTAAAPSPVPAEWIAVQERLPAPYAVVLACAGNVCMARRVARPAHQEGGLGWRVFPETPTDGWLEVSHWMPLPAAPGAPTPGQQEG
jgi:hypothetical protein